MRWRARGALKRYTGDHIGDIMSGSTQPGGASNISGVLYQTLWCLLRALRIRVCGPEGGDATEALLVLEPAGGGGDVRVLGAITEIEQLKAKSDSGTWSLQTIIRDVLPDLFLAVPTDSRTCRFRFITEGSRGRWSEVGWFFQRLGKAEPPDNILKELDDERVLKFQTARRTGAADRTATPFFVATSYTERSLFLLIANELRSHAAITEMNLDDAELYRRLWRMLGAFEFVGGQDRETVQREIDSLLLAVVDRKEEIPRIRDALALCLIRKAGAGNAEITAESLLAENNLNATPLTNWSTIRSGSRDELDRHLRYCKYDPELDVRKSRMKPVARAWRDSARTIVIAGESGQGKTWSLAAVATAAANDEAPVLWVEATGDAAQDLQTAADQFCLDIRGGETSIPLRQLAARLETLVPTNSRQRLRLCIDNVLDYNEAATIIREDWPSRGVSIALSCSSEIASSLKQAFADSFDELTCEDFSWEELHELLERRLGSGWTTIPDDVRETLRRPLLAGIYCDELVGDQWQPTNEYELYAMLWHRLSTQHQTAAPLDVVLIELLVEAVLRGETYPWTLRQLLDSGVDNEAVRRLERCGWLVRTSDNRIRIFHDRLLNWAVAETLVSLIRSGKHSLADVITQVGELNKADGRIGTVFLGYVPMDTLWLLTGDTTLSGEAGSKFLATLEQGYGRQPDVLYREMAPTLGERVAGALFQRYCENEGFPWVRRAISDAIVKTAPGRVAEFAGSLLNDAEPRRQRLGLKLLRNAPCPELLDRIWQLHSLGLREPKPFLDEHEEGWTLREDSWRALRDSAVTDPEWIIRRVELSNAAVEPVHDLGWLIANLPNGSKAWEKSKKKLFESVDVDRVRVLAKCVGLFRDAEHTAWLKARVADEHHMCAPVALQALSRLAPDEAVDALPRTDLKGLQFTTRWAFSEVWHRRPSATDAQLIGCAKTSANPWLVGFLYRDRVNDVPPELFEILLGCLDQQLEQKLSQSGDSSTGSLFRELSFVAEAVAPNLLDAIQAKQGSTLESRLTEYLRRVGPQKGIFRNGLERDPGLAILRRINGDGFTRIVNEFMEGGDRYGRHDASQWAVKHPNETTFQIAAGIIEGDELWSDFPLNQNDTMKLLATHHQWHQVAKGLMRWGLKTSVDLTENRLVPRDYSAPWVNEFRLAANESPTPGCILALAFCGNDGDIEPIQSLLESIDPESELAHTCVLGLEMLGDTSPRGVGLVAQQLAIEKHHYSAHRMLTCASTPEACDALWNDLLSRFDHITALNLLNLSSHADETARLVVDRLPSRKEFGDWGLLRILILNMPSQFKERILGDRWLREKFHRAAVAAEGSSWLTGSKAAAIECLAEFDRDTAFEAARRALYTPGWHDREHYPYILMEIDASRATPLLIEHLDAEHAGEVRHAIGRVLAGVQLSEVLRPRFDAKDFKIRASACFAAGWARDGAEMTDLLQRSLDDPNENVIREAMDAVDRLRIRSICRKLLARATSADDVVLKWIYIDAIVDVIDPGDSFEPWPAELQTACQDLSPILLKYISERVKKRRKKLFDELKKERQKD